MILETKIKQTAILAAADICLKRLKRAPVRCARNLTELGYVSYPGKLSLHERDEFFQKLLQLCKNNDTKEAKDLFVTTFLKEQAD